MIKKLILALLLLFPIISIAGIPAKDKNKSKAKAIVTVTTYDKTGQKLHSGYGFFITETGSALAPYSLFNNASKAEIVDYAGKKWEVTRIEGASDLYDVVKFKTTCAKSAIFATATKAIAKDANVTRFFSDENEGLVQATAKVTEIKKYNDLNYFTLASKSEDKTAGTPILDQGGRIVGIMQQNSEGTITKSFAIDIAVERLLETSALSAGQEALNKILIPKQLPADTTQAASYLYLLSKNTQDTTSYLAAIADFKAAYPTVTTSYIEHANFLVAQKQYAQAKAKYDEALNNVTDKAEIHYNLSKTIYRLNLYKDYQVYDDWDLNKALSEAQQAYQLNQLPLYLLQLGDCQFALKQYQEAFDTYQTINQTSFASPQTFFYAARARELQDDDSTAVLALLDSAVARFPKPYHSDAAPYILQRAQHLQKYEQYKASAIDYDTYEKIIGTKNLNDKFFYMKEQVDFNALYYPWALADIEKALQINPKEYLYIVEKAVIQLHVGDNDEAIFAAQQALKVNPDGADAYKVMGIAYGQKNNKTEAIKYLKKAKELGDPQVDEWIQKLK